MYEEMKQVGLSGDTVTFTTLINGALGFGRLDLVHDLLAEAKSMHVMIERHQLNNFIAFIESMHNVSIEEWDYYYQRIVNLCRKGF